MTDLLEGQIWRKHGPYGWLKIIQILDPEYSGHDGGLPGSVVVYFPPQLKGIQCRGGARRFIADDITDGVITSWGEQIVHNRHLLSDFKRGEEL